MTPIVVAGVLFCLLASNAGAFDTASKFGMGLRFWGLPFITFANMKIGLNNALGLEPSGGYYTWKDQYGSYESSSSILILSLIGDINAIQAERSNFVVKLGGAFAKTDDTGGSSTGFGVLGGIGIEHFVNHNFSVNVGTLSGFWTSSLDDYDATSSLMSFNNQLVDFSLVWYLR